MKIPPWPGRNNEMFTTFCSKNKCVYQVEFDGFYIDSDNTTNRVKLYECKHCRNRLVLFCFNIIKPEEDFPTIPNGPDSGSTKDAA